MAEEALTIKCQAMELQINALSNMLTEDLINALHNWLKSK